MCVCECVSVYTVIRIVPLCILFIQQIRICCIDFVSLFFFIYFLRTYLNKFGLIKTSLFHNKKKTEMCVYHVFIFFLLFFYNLLPCRRFVIAVAKRVYRKNKKLFDSISMYLYSPYRFSIRIIFSKIFIHHKICTYK